MKFQFVFVYSCMSVSLHYCAFALLYCCIVVLLYCCIVISLYCYTIDYYIISIFSEIFCSLVTGHFIILSKIASFHLNCLVQHILLSNDASLYYTILFTIKFHYMKLHVVYYTELHSFASGTLNYIMSDLSKQIVLCSVTQYSFISKHQYVSYILYIYMYV